MRGETVEVKTRAVGGTDPYGAPVKVDSVEAVENVLVAPGECSDVVESNRPEGVRVAYTLFFPKTFTGDLEGAQVRVRGKDPWLPVIGSPDVHTPENIPGKWWLRVEVAATDG